MVKIAGQAKATSIISGSIYLISAGSSDFVQNYYINPALYQTYTPDQFSAELQKNVYTFIQVPHTHLISFSTAQIHQVIFVVKMLSLQRCLQNLYGLGARRIGVTSLPPIGCLPAAITLFGSGNNQCVDRMNQDAVSFNSKLKNTVDGLQKKFSGLKMVTFDIYQPLLDLVSKPSEHGALNFSFKTAP